MFATLDAGAAKTVGLYFMYDVKQFDAAEWKTAPPLSADMVDKAGFGKVMVGRGAVNQKGPQSALLAALHAIKGAGKKMPVNLVLVAEGEEEIGSPNIAGLVLKPEVKAALEKCVGVFMPSTMQGPDGVVTVNLGSKGVVELELVSTGEKWGRSLKAMIDSPSWHLIKALDTLVSDDGNNIAIENCPKPRPLSADEKETSTAKESPLIQAQVSTLKRAGIDALLWPRNAGSYPGYIFTGEPLRLAAGHFGLGHGSGAHAPDEYYLIESTNPKIEGYDGAVISFVEYLDELAK